MQHDLGESDVFPPTTKHDIVAHHQSLFSDQRRSRQQRKMMLRSTLAKLGMNYLNKQTWTTEDVGGHPSSTATTQACGSDLRSSTKIRLLWLVAERSIDGRAVARRWS